MTNNKHLFKNENGVLMCKVEKSRAVLPARAVCRWYLQKICAAKKWIFCDGANDGGIDCITPKGKKTFQCKVITAESRSSIPFCDMIFSTKEQAENFSNDEMLELIKGYVELFNGNLIAYITTYRGDAFDMKNAHIIEDKQGAIKFLYERASQSYGKKPNGDIYRQIKISMHPKRTYNE